jgi:hypothetical protein
MTRLALAVSAMVAAVAGGAGPTRADPYDSFQALCIVASGDQHETARLAGSLGWSPAPAEMVAGFAVGAPNAVGFVNYSPVDAAPADGEFVVASRGVTIDPAGRTIDVSTCAVVSQLSVAAAVGRVESWLGQGAPQDDGGGVWVYTMDGARPVSALEVAAAGEQALEALMKQRPVYMLSVIADSGGAGLFLGIMQEPR